MTRLLKTIARYLTVLLLAAALPLTGAFVIGCDDEGPAEEVGEDIDEAVDEAGDAAEDVADEAEDAADEATD